MAIGLDRLSAATCVACLIAIPAYTQEPSSPAPAPANLAFVDGVVDVVQDGVTERADPPVMLIDGDMVRTRNGRAEIVFGDGALLHLSHGTDLEVLAEQHLRLMSGRTIVRISHAPARPYVIDTPSSSVRLDAEGEYDITTDRTARLEVAVTRGTAHIGDAPTWTAIGGQRITLAGPDERPLIEPFNTARGDAFAQWTADRTYGAASSSSAAQLPYQLRPYASTLDHYGRWDYLAPHGYVWVPSVGAGWRPYYDGAWSFTRYGWTWRGHERWAWPTHHYGRWGFTGAVWYWVPAALWGPAWVSWSVAPGYVGWAPLGWHHSVGWSSWSRRDSPAYSPNYNPWRGWTVVHRDHFAPRRHVRTHAIGSDRLDEITRQRLLTEADGVTRRQPRALPRESEVTLPARRGAVRRPPTVRPIDASAPRSDPNPAYAPAPPRASDARRGMIREPRRSGTTPPREGAADAPAPSSPRGVSSGEASGGARAAEGRGAVRRGEAARTPSRGEATRAPARGASPPAATPPATSRPASEGGARRRPGA